MLLLFLVLPESYRMFIQKLQTDHRFLSEIFSVLQPLRGILVNFLMLNINYFRKYLFFKLASVGSSTSLKRC